MSETCPYPSQLATDRIPAPSYSWGDVQKGLLVSSPAQSRHQERRQGLPGLKGASLEGSNLAQSAVKPTREDVTQPLASWSHSR